MIKEGRAMEEVEEKLKSLGEIIEDLKEMQKYQLELEQELIEKNY